jgi:hypothetical protein
MCVSTRGGLQGEADAALTDLVKKADADAN